MTDFERIKDTLDLLSVITQETGLSMKGPHLESCPFCGHHDCFSIYDNKRKYKCWSCESTGDVFNFIEEYRQVERSESLKIAADMAHIELSDKRESARPREKAESLQEQIYRLAAEYYHDAMLGDSAAQEWFIGKRGHKLDTLKKMRVGYSTNGLLAFLQEVGIPATDVVKYGLAKDKDKEERKIEPKDYFWKGLVIFPVSDHTGKVLSFTCKDPQKKYRGLMLENVKKSWFLNHAVLGKTHDAFLVEGQNDEASLRDIGVQNVLGTAGAPSQEQMTLLKNFYSGKTLYLWFDLDEQENYKKYTGGAHHIKFICTALRESDVTLRIIIHPGNAKDPDEFIQGLLRDRKTAVEIRTILRSMKEDALDPLAWELHLLKQIPEVKERLEAFKLRKLPQALNAIASTADQEVYLDMAAKAIGISVKAVEELVNNAADLYKNISDMFGGEAGIKKADPLRLAEHIFRWFNNGAGAKFFKTKDGKVWLFYSRKIYEIDNNLDFNTLMLQLTRLAAVEKPGSTVWYFLRTLCNAHGEPVDMMSWMHTDRERDTIYLNLNSSHNKIIRIAPAEDPRVIDNGTNEQSVLLA
ncbi:MAG: CHC2 zinc finger domain-containing protein, partial [Candidatus Sulfobium sp.]